MRVLTVRTTARRDPANRVAGQVSLVSITNGAGRVSPALIAPIRADVKAARGWAYVCRGTPCDVSPSDPDFETANLAAFVRRRSPAIKASEADFSGALTSRRTDRLDKS
jgi:hypothetical protein